MIDILSLPFPVSGVKTWVFIPPLVAFGVSFFTSMGGVSGAFLLLPFQMSILHYTAPSVSGTNQLFNIIATPSGVWRYTKEKRMLWPLTWAVAIGTLPGVIIGAWVRLEFLPNPKDFKLFAGFVLLYIGIKLLLDVLKREKSGSKNGKDVAQKTDFTVTDVDFSLTRVRFHFSGERHSFSVPVVVSLCFIVGIIGGIYGIGGGSIVAPFLVAFFHLPVHVIAGAALMGTFVTSIAGVTLYQLLAASYAHMSVAPDWFLGSLFGIGGFFGMYFGAKCQKYASQKTVKCILCCCVLFVAGRYLFAFFS
ncbi:MAG: hypothetical protein CSB23_00100 [Deltaproteobacteria bacterium]|nr:MAG: hypothetical protein CSB23_00100 [Deltaproteobacteria bacterium]